MTAPEVPAAAIEAAFEALHEVRDTEYERDHAERIVAAALPHLDRPLRAEAWREGYEAHEGHAEALWEHSREAEPGMGDPPRQPENPYEGDAP